MIFMDFPCKEETHSLDDDIQPFLVGCDDIQTSNTGEYWIFLPLRHLDEATIRKMFSLQRR